MNVYDAMLKAADYIEKNPEQYNFMRGDKPECGTPGCLLGWTGVFMKFETQQASYVSALADRLGADFHVILGRFLNLGWEGKQYLSYAGRDSDAAKNGARVLRLYAAKCHAPVKPAMRTNAELVAALKQTIDRQTIPEGAIRGTHA